MWHCRASTREWGLNGITELIKADLELPEVLNKHALLLLLNHTHAMCESHIMKVRTFITLVRRLNQWPLFSLSTL